MTPIELVPVDSTLRKDLEDATGRVLLPAGSRLTATLLTALQQRGITAVPLVPAASATTDAASPEVVDQLRQHVDWLFHHAGQAPVVAQLRQVVLNYRLGKIIAQSSLGTETES